MEIKKLNSLMRAMDQTSAKTMKLETRTVKLKIVKKVPGKIVGTVPEIKTEIQVSPKELAKAANETSPVTKQYIVARSIGFFSRYNKKEKQQFVKLRDVVKEGEIIGVITSMHVDHNVVAETSGKIVEFLVEEGQPVEYGQPLIRLEAN